MTKRYRSRRPDDDQSNDEIPRYGDWIGFYVVASLAWLRAVEGVRPDRWDAVGALICLVGALVIVLGRR